VFRQADLYLTCFDMTEASRMTTMVVGHCQISQYTERWGSYSPMDRSAATHDDLAASYLLDRSWFGRSIDPSWIVHRQLRPFGSLAGPIAVSLFSLHQRRRDSVVDKDPLGA